MSALSGGERGHRLLLACGLASVCAGAIFSGCYAAMLFYMKEEVGRITPLSLGNVARLFVLASFIALCVTVPFAMIIRKAWRVYRVRGRHELEHGVEKPE